MNFLCLLFCFSFFVPQRIGKKTNGVLLFTIYYLPVGSRRNGSQTLHWNFLLHFAIYLWFSMVLYVFTCFLAILLCMKSIEKKMKKYQQKNEKAKQHVKKIFAILFLFFLTFFAGNKFRYMQQQRPLAPKKSLNSYM